MEANGIKDNELWLRCWVCGDSTKSTRKAHASINLLTAQWHCHRCGEGGQLSPHDAWQKTGGRFWDTTATRPATTWEEMTPTQQIEYLEEHLVPGPGTNRPSVVEPRAHIFRKGNLVDVFGARDARGRLVGYSIRDVDKKRLITVGRRGLGYMGDDLLGCSTVRIVEGPYDVLSAEDVCTFGLPSNSQVQQLQGLTLILCPDGDLWYRPNLLQRYLARFRDCYVAWVERIPDGADPDETPEEDRYRYPPSLLWASTASLAAVQPRSGA